MNHRLHLVVIQSNYNINKEDPSQVCKLYNPNRYDFVWNDDYTSFRAIKLAWWDDASYIDYQTRGIHSDMEEFE